MWLNTYTKVTKTLRHNGVMYPAMRNAIIRGYLEIVKYLVEECGVNCNDDYIRMAYDPGVKSYLQTHIH